MRARNHRSGRGRLRALAGGVAVTAALAGLAGCSQDSEPAPSNSDSASATTDPSTPASSPAAPSSSATPSPSGAVEPTDPAPEGGTVQAPAKAEEVTDLLDWQQLDGGDTELVTRVGEHTVTFSQNGDAVAIAGPKVTTDLTPPTRYRFNEVLSDGDRLVVVAQDSQETKPSIATVVDLTTGDQSVIDGNSTPPTTNGGSWAVGTDGSIFHATLDGQKYCLAQVDSDGAGETPYCAPRNAGYSSVMATPTGTSMLTFSGQPQCRTPVALDGLTPIEGPAKCKGWDSALTENGAIWSVVTNESRVEDADFGASANGGFFDLGPGTTGSLTWCGDAAYFVRDAQKDVDKARLLRWTPATAQLAVVYESPGQGQAFLSEPRCAGDTLSISAFAEGGDEQVWANVGS